jgi:hypothetical protein
MIKLRRAQWASCSFPFRFHFGAAHCVMSITVAIARQTSAVSVRKVKSYSSCRFCSVDTAHGHICRCVSQLLVHFCPLLVRRFLCSIEITAGLFLFSHCFRNCSTRWWLGASVICNLRSCVKDSCTVSCSSVDSVHLDGLVTFLP